MPNKIFTKAQLKPFMTVELRDGKKSLCTQTENGELLFVDKADRRLSLEEYNNSLEFIGHKELDVMKIYNPSAATLCLGIDIACNDKNLIFERFFFRINNRNFSFIFRFRCYLCALRKQRSNKT